MRLFVAVELSGAVQEQVLSVRGFIVELLTRQGVRIVKPEKLHLTLAFLGDVDDGEVESLKAALNSFVGRSSFPIGLGSLGGFPDMHRPKVIWIGLGEGESVLAQLSTQISLATLPNAPQQDRKPFSGHVTLARVSPGSKEVGRIVSRIANPTDSAVMTVKGIALIHSRRDGSYEKIHDVQFEGG